MLSVRKLYFSLCLLLIVLVFATFVISVDFGGGDRDDVSSEERAKFDDDGQITPENLPYAEEQLKAQTGVGDINLKAGDSWDGESLHTSVDGVQVRIPLDDFSGSVVEITDTSVKIDGDEWEGISEISKTGEATNTPDADYANYNNNEFWNIIDASFFPNGFNIGSASRIKTDRFYLEDANNVINFNESLILEEAGKFQLEGAVKVKAGDAEFSDIGESIIHVGEDLEYANIVSAKNNNTFTIANGDLNITMDKNDRAVITKNLSTGKYDVSIDSERDEF